MTVEEFIRRLQQYPPDMQVKIVSDTIKDITTVVQDGEDFVKVMTNE